MPEQPNDLDLCIENLNDRSWWEQIPSPVSAQRVIGVWEDLQCNRFGAQDRLADLLTSSRRLVSIYRRWLGPMADEHLGDLLKFVLDRLVRNRHRRRALFESGLSFPRADALAAYVTERWVIFSYKYPHWKRQQKERQELVSLSEPLGEDGGEWGDLLKDPNALRQLQEYVERDADEDEFNDS